MNYRGYGGSSGLPREDAIPSIDSASRAREPGSGTDVIDITVDSNTTENNIASKILDWF